MEETPEGLAAAAATREAAKRKRADGEVEEDNVEVPPSKRATQSAALLRHEVVTPKTQAQRTDPSSLDPQLHGAFCPVLCQVFCSSAMHRQRVSAFWSLRRYPAGAAMARTHGEGIPIHTGPFSERRHRVFGASRLRLAARHVFVAANGHAHATESLDAHASYAMSAAPRRLNEGWKLDCTKS